MTRRLDIENLIRAGHDGDECETEGSAIKWEKQ